MARIPEWFQRLDPIMEVLRSSALEWLGRKDIGALFGVSERDSIRLLHRFGATERDNALAVTRADLLMQLEAIRAGSTYAAFLSQRNEVAQALSAAREQVAAREFRISPPGPVTRLENLPETITWMRPAGGEQGRFEILYKDGADLMNQIAEFLTAAGGDRQRFFSNTEPAGMEPGE